MAGVQIAVKTADHAFVQQYSYVYCTPCTTVQLCVLYTLYNRTDMRTVHLVQQYVPFTADIGSLS